MQHCTHVHLYTVDIYTCMVDMSQCVWTSFSTVRPFTPGQPLTSWTWRLSSINTCGLGISPYIFQLSWYQLMRKYLLWWYTSVLYYRKLIEFHWIKSLKVSQWRMHCVQNVQSESFFLCSFLNVFFPPLGCVIKPACIFKACRNSWINYGIMCVDDNCLMCSNARKDL